MWAMLAVGLIVGAIIMIVGVFLGAAIMQNGQEQGRSQFNFNN